MGCISSKYNNKTAANNQVGPTILEGTRIQILDGTPSQMSSPGLSQLPSEKSSRLPVNLPSRTVHKKVNPRQRYSQHYSGDSSSMNLLPEHSLTQYTEGKSASSKTIISSKIDTAIYDSYLDIVVITDCYKKIHYANGMVETTLHKNPKRVLGLSVYDLFTESGEFSKLDTFYSMLDTMKEINFRAFIRIDKGARKIWVNVHLISCSGFVYVFIRDISVEMHLQKC